MIRLSFSDGVQAWKQALTSRSSRCHMCGAAGHTDKADLRHDSSLTALSMPSCGNVEHASCGRCLGLLPKHQRKCSCLPFVNGTCDGKFDTWAPRRPRFSARVKISCPSCSGTVLCTRSSLVSGGVITKCEACGHKFCPKCGDESCCCHQVAEKDCPGCFSRFFTKPDGSPIRKRDITAEVVRNELRRRQIESEDVEEGFSVPCGCGVHLARTSACHELSHCGRKVCWASGRHSLPWEPCLPSWHWEEVPRWEHELPVPEFACREGFTHGRLRVPRPSTRQVGRRWLGIGGG